MTGPFFLNVVGADGVGKSSVGSEVSRLTGATIVKTPGPAFDGLRLMAEDLTPTARFWFYASAVAMSKKRILDALRTGPVVVDRYIQCTVAFHAAMGVDIPFDIAALLDLPAPTLTIHLTVSPDEAARRIAARTGSRPDAVIEQNTDLQRKVVEQYGKLADYGFTGNFLPIRICTNDRTPLEVAQEIVRMLAG